MKMKQLLSLLLSALMLFGCVCGCAGDADPTQTTAADATQESQYVEPPRPTETDDGVLRIFTIGNSHTNDCNQLLYEVFRAEAPQQQVMIGYLYYSGCKIEQHIQFAPNNQGVYEYSLNADGNWVTVKSAEALRGLSDQPWDIVVLHEMNVAGSMRGAYANENINTLIKWVNDNLPNPHSFVWNLSWANPVDERLFAPDFDPQPPSGWKGTYQTLYNMDRDRMFSGLLTCTKEYILPNQSFYCVLPTGTAMHYAYNMTELDDMDLFRDYTHISDYGRLIAAYVWYAKFMGLTELTEVNVDVVPKDLRAPRFKKYGDLEITAEMKQQLLDSVNYALKNPFTLPAQTGGNAQ